jgi:uncharacterized membrane protein
MLVTDGPFSGTAQGSSSSIVPSLPITTTELVSGLIINRRLGLTLWDYGELPFNLLGQICLQYSLMWIVISAAGIVIDDYLRWKLYGEARPRYTIF